MVDWLGIGLVGIGVLFAIAGISMILEVPQIIGLIQQFLGFILLLIGGIVGYFGYKLVRIAEG